MKIKTPEDSKIQVKNSNELNFIFSFGNLILKNTIRYFFVEFTRSFAK